MNAFVLNWVLVVLVPVNGSFIPHDNPSNNLVELRNRIIDTGIDQGFSFETQGTTISERPVRFLVHFNHRACSRDRELLQFYGLKVESYIPNGAYLVYGDPHIAEDLLSYGWIDWFGNYLAQDKIDPVLYQDQSWDSLEVMLFPEADPQDVANLLIDWGVEVYLVTANQYNGKLIIVQAGDRLEDIAGLDGVRWIEPRYPVQLDNDAGQWVIQTWQPQNRRIWDEGLNGEGVIGSSSDSGINTDHWAFADSSVSIHDWGDYPQHRKIVAYQPLGFFPEFGDDMVGHGTHTVGTICGDDSYWGGDAVYAGMAPKARLYFVDLGGSGEMWNLPADYRDLYVLPQTGNTAGQAKFMSNSWGSGYGYNSHAWETDYFMWEHPEFLIIYSAGNNGPLVTAPKEAKSIVTVAATNRGEDADRAAGFSNPGPAGDGRIKPTLAAPGVDVFSATSSGNSGYKQMSGTSMACPTVAGATALVVQYLREGWYPTGEPIPENAVEPSASLLKAMLVASADANLPDYHIPNYKLGWGRIDLDSVLYFPTDTRKLYLYDDQSGLETGDIVSFETEIGQDSYPLKVVLVWTDAPPDMAAAKQLVNNLDLEVYTPSGQLYCGNHFYANYSQPGPGADDTNVEEVVRIGGPQIGTWSIQVKATEVPQGPQPFAVVVTGALKHHDINLCEAGIVIDDSQNPDPNGGIDPGEEVTVYPCVANLGDYYASQVTGMLSVDNEDVTILSSSGQYGDIPGGATSDLAGFTIQASSGLHMGDSLILDLRLEANQGIYVKTVSYPLIVGVDIAEEPETCELSLEAPLVPFREYLNVKLAIPCIGPVELDLYDCTGRKVRTFINRPAYPSGICEYSFTAVDDYGKHLGTGVYFLKLTTESGDVSQKVIHLR